MEHGYSILMFIFAGLLLIYGAILAISGSVNLIPKSDKAKISDPKSYVRGFAAAVALVAVPVAFSAGFAYVGMPVWLVLAILILGTALCLWVATQLV